MCGVRHAFTSASVLCLLAGGVLTGLACGGGAGRGSAGAGSSSVLPPGRTLPEGTVSSLGFSCDRTAWRVGFTLTRPTGVSGVLDRRTQSGWTHVQNLSPARLEPGPRALALKPHGAGDYRVRLRFRTAGGSFSRAIVFHAGCANPPPPVTTPTLPGTTGTLPVE
jgi:hypothetical protein